MVAMTRLRVLVAVLVLNGLTACNTDDVPPATEDASAAATPAAGTAGQPTTAESSETIDRMAPVTVGGVEIEPECEPSPVGEDTEAFFSTLITGGGAARILPGEPAFPSDYCPEDARFATVGGLTTRGTGTIGDWAWQGRGSCALPGSILWAMHDIQAESGTISVLEETQVIFPDGCVPGETCNAPLRFDGRFSILGGTGQYEQAQGMWRGVGRQRGDGTSAVVLCGWLTYAGGM